MELMERIAAYNALLDRKAQLADETTENNKAIEQARRDLADLMIDAEIDRVSSGGYTFTLSEKTAFSKRGGTDEQLFAVLREDGLGDIIRETVNPRTLQATLKEVAEQNDGELPAQYDGLVSVYRYMDVGRRKA